MPKTRVVIDTNVMVGSAYAPTSSSRRVVNACRQGKLQLIVSDAVCEEYQRILGRAVRLDRERERLLNVIQAAELVLPRSTPAVFEADPTDDKFMAAAVWGQADALITNDRYVLNHDPHEGIRIVRPSVFLALAEA